jgi:hypothetical protein
VPDREFTAEEVDAALAKLVEPGRLDHAQAVVTHAAPALQRILAEALHDGGWFTGAHEAQVQAAVDADDPQERLRRISTLVAEEARLAMLVGATVGFELHQELTRPHDPTPQEGP